MKLYPLFLQSLWIAVEAITHNKLRAILTSLGIVFGVGSVISMLAVGRFPARHTAGPLL